VAGRHAAIREPGLFEDAGRGRVVKKDMEYQRLDAALARMTHDRAHRLGSETETPREAADPVAEFGRPRIVAKPRTADRRPVALAQNGERGFAGAVSSRNPLANADGRTGTRH